MSRSLTLRDCLYAALFTALISVLGLVTIPINIIPITAQSLGVMLAGSILTTRQAAMSLTTYLLLGAVGAPVFSGGKGGLGIIAGPTGGYLIGFLAAAIAISLLKGSGNNFIRIGISNILGGIIVIYAFGISWLMIKTGMGLEAAIIANLKYIPGDIIKACIATPVALAVNKQVKYLVKA